MIQELTDLQDYFWSSSEESTRLSIGLHLCFYYKTTSETTRRVWCVWILPWGSLYIGWGELPSTKLSWFGGDGWPGGHPHGRPATPPGFHQLSGIGYSCEPTCERRRQVSVRTNSKYGRTTMGLGRPAGPWAPLTCCLAPRGLRVTNVPVVTLSLVEFHMFL
jgi:hypothetical protein